MADAFPKDRFDVYIVLARLTSFTAEEVEAAKAGNGQYDRRVIMLTDRELEPYVIYERTAKEFDIECTAVSLEDLAQVTERVFFQNARRAASDPGEASLEG